MTKPSYRQEWSLLVMLERLGKQSISSHTKTAKALASSWFSVYGLRNETWKLWLRTVEIAGVQKYRSLHQGAWDKVRSGAPQPICSSIVP